MNSRLAVLVFVLLLPLSLFAQAVAPSGQAAPVGEAAAAETPVEQSSALENISLHTLLEASRGVHGRWRPDWPPELPPDLFAAPGSVSVAVQLDDGTSLELSGSGGRPGTFPVLTELGEEAALVQGRAEYDSRGRLSRLFWGEADAEALRWDEENRPVLFRVFTGDYSFAALEYLPHELTETWYDREGAPLVIFTSQSGMRSRFFVSPGHGEGPEGAPDPGKVLLFYHTNEGLISQIEIAGGKTLSALYNEKGTPLYLGRKDGGQDYNWRYQWDEAGFLVRFSGGTGEDPVDYRYEYTLDSRGNWTERRALAMEEAGGVLVPVRIDVIRRTIRYE